VTTPAGASFNENPSWSDYHQANQVSLDYGSGLKSPNRATAYSVPTICHTYPQNFLLECGQL